MRMARALAAWLMGGVALGGTARQAHAEDPPATWLDWKTMTGDWGGLRPELVDDGITITAHYVSETAGNPVGGREQGGAYSGEFGLGADIASTLLGYNGGTLHALITERAGSSLSKDKIGNLLTVQEIYGDGQTVRVTQLSYEQKLAGNRLDLEAGYINTENNFATSPKYFGTIALYCYYQNNSICGTPIAAPVNTNGYVAYPASSLGARVRVDVLKDVYIGAGAYEVNPTLYQAVNGFKLGTSGAEGVLTVVETGWTPGFGGMEGNYRLGAYYDNSANRTAIGQATRFIPANSPVLGLLPFASRAGKNGFWALADQQITTGPDDTGTAVFANLQYGDHNTALITWYGEAGLVRQGMFGRSNDSAAIGFAIANLNDELLQFEKAHGTPGTAQEYMLEVNYGIALARWFNLRPGIQYVWHPSGEDERRNAVVLALKTSITF